MNNQKDIEMWFRAESARGIVRFEIDLRVVTTPPKSEHSLAPSPQLSPSHLAPFYAHGLYNSEPHEPRYVE